MKIESIAGWCDRDERVDERDITVVEVDAEGFL